MGVHLALTRGLGSEGKRACAAVPDAVCSYIIMQHTAVPSPHHPIHLTDFEPDWMLLKKTSNHEGEAAA